MGIYSKTRIGMRVGYVYEQENGGQTDWNVVATSSQKFDQVKTSKSKCPYCYREPPDHVEMRC
jgi:hypothetical protein